MGRHADACRERAVECVRLAGTVTNTGGWLTYLDLAKQRRQTAEQAEFFELLPDRTGAG